MKFAAWAGGLLLAVPAWLFIALVVWLLVGCGGGEEPEDERSDSMPVPCDVRPELCR